ncbi:MAG: hypothetical protein KDC27_07995 [Acidobacteria bacterium]|nr:hypothetical protein [Acidobacteriota bacterium]
MTRTLPLFLLAVAASAQHPSAEFHNGLIQANVWLPDPQNGYYRGTRFDWSGAISSLRFAGHEYFGEWQQSDDPYLHDRITGPVEEYRTHEKGLGYDEAKPGGTFLRIGVGVVEKPEEDDYRWTFSYPVKDPGKWTIRKGENWIEFEQEALDPSSGYGYRLRKRLTLPPGKAQLIIDHTLENIGSKRIETNVYNHNFFVLDNQPTGPDFSVRFAFPPKADRDWKGYVEIEGDTLRYTKELPQGQSVIALLDGFSGEPDDHSFAIENRAVGAGVRMQADKPLSKLQFWSPRTTLCPEPFIELALAPGESDRWTLYYEFYELGDSL